MSFLQEWTRRLGQLQRQIELVSGADNSRSNEPVRESNGSHTVSAAGQHTTVWDERSTPSNTGNVDGCNLTDVGSEHGSEQQSGDSASMSDVEVRAPVAYQMVTKFVCDT